MFIIFLKNFYTPSPCGDFPYIRGRIWDRFLGTVCSPVRERVVPLPGNSSFPYRGIARSLIGEHLVPLPGNDLFPSQAYLYWTCGPSSFPPPSPTVKT